MLLPSVSSSFLIISIFISLARYQMPIQDLYLKVSKEPQNRYVQTKLWDFLPTHKAHTPSDPKSLISFSISCFSEWYYYSCSLTSQGSSLIPPCLSSNPSPFSLAPTSYICRVPTWKTIVVYPGELHGSVVDFLWTRHIPLLLQAMRCWDCFWPQNNLAYPFSY